MSTTTEATEGQAKIRRALEHMVEVAKANDWPMIHNQATVALAALDASPPIVGEPVAWMRESDKALVKDRIKNDGEGTFQDFAIPLYAAQAPQSSPAPSVIEAGDALRNAMAAQGVYDRGEGRDRFAERGDKLVAAWDAAKASRPSVTPKHMNLEDGG